MINPWLLRKMNIELFHLELVDAARAQVLAHRDFYKRYAPTLEPYLCGPVKNTDDAYQWMKSAVFVGDKHVCRWLVKTGLIDIEKGQYRTAKARHLTPLIFAAEYNLADMCVFLVRELGANLETSTGEGTTAIAIAALNNKVEACRVLCELGANVNSISSDGRTPLMWASIGNSLECCKHLLAYGANVNVNATTKGVMTALLHTIEADRLDICRLLCAVPGINVHSYGIGLPIPLVWAIDRRQVDICKLLCFMGAEDDPGIIMHTPGINRISLALRQLAFRAMFGEERDKKSFEIVRYMKKTSVRRILLLLSAEITVRKGRRKQSVFGRIITLDLIRHLESYLG